MLLVWVGIGVKEFEGTTGSLHIYASMLTARTFSSRLLSPEDSGCIL